MIRLAATAFALVTTLSALAQTNYTGNIDVMDSDFRPVQLTPNLLLFPGEVITVELSGKADINHHHYEVRKCSWAGLKCKWVPRSRANWRQVSELQLKVGLFTASGELVKGTEKIWTGAKAHIIEYPDSYQAGFATPLRLKAYFTSWNGNSYTRTRCSGRPRYCSAGSPTITIKSKSVDSRLTMLKAELNSMGNNLNAVDPVHIRSDRFIDSLLRDSDDKREKLQTLFADMIECWVGTSKVGFCNVRQPNSAPELQSRILDVARFAKTIHSDPNQLSRLNGVMFDSYITQGDYETLISEAPDAILKAEQAYKTNGNAGNAIRLADLIRGTGIARLEKRARYSSTDVRFAVGLMEQAISILEKHVKDKGSESDETYEKVLATLSSYYIDTSRMMNVLRTQAELRYAERILVRAVCVKELSLNRQRNQKEIIACLSESS